MESVLATRPVVNVGDEFERLSVIGKPFNVRVGSASKRMQHAVCRCRCGQIVVARCSVLKIGRLLSCGCFHADELKQRNYKHGLAPRGIRKPYDHWCHMRERCLDESHSKYHRYGGRGITICPEWESPVAFCEWAMANGWEPGLQLDRINNSGNYEPTNCRFVTHAENQRNR